ncbi:MAG: translation initiation factor [Opitutales bacterium]|nr:translation initiation factor [Opitutales bacterium]
MAKKKERIDTAGGEALGADNPFGALSLDGLSGDRRSAPPPPTAPLKKGSRGNGHGDRLEIRRLKSGKGGKTVTEIRGFPPAARRHLPELAKALKTRLGVGGAVKGDTIEVQGDNREAVASCLRERGYRPVFAGG